MGLQLRRHLDRDRPRPPPARENRSRPVQPPVRVHRLGGRLPVRAVIRPRWWAPVVIGVCGVGGSVGVAAAGGIPSRDIFRLVAISCLGAALAAAVAAVLLSLLARRGIAAQAVIATLSPVLAVAIGVTWASSGMFLMGHDLWVLWVVLTASGSVALMAALILGRRVADASRSVGAMARQLGEHGPGVLTESREGRGAPQELSALAAELTQTSARLAEAQEQTAAVERSRRELVAWVSHDLRTPLAGIRAMVEALEDRVVEDPETVDRYHRTMRLEADRLAGLVDDLFELSRIHAGALDLELARVSLDELVSEAVAGASIAATAKGVDLTGQVDEPPPVVELSTPEMAR